MPHAHAPVGQHACPPGVWHAVEWLRPRSALGAAAVLSLPLGINTTSPPRHRPSRSRPDHQSHSSIQTLRPPTRIHLPRATSVPPVTCPSLPLPPASLNRRPSGKTTTRCQSSTESGQGSAQRPTIATWSPACTTSLEIDRPRFRQGKLSPAAPF